ncbi:MAG TPA: methanol/ethanol family PQQ-dependent dehydrogenase [Longimicrobium sp.]
MFSPSSTSVRSGVRRLPLALCACAVLLAACKEGNEPEDQPSTVPGPSATPPTEVRGAATPDDGQWLMASKDYANTRFSGLAQITAQNVASLKLAWTFTTGNTRGHEGAPLVVGNTMYVVTPFPNFLYALDLTRQGEVKWSYRPPFERSAPGVACCDLVNRGAAYADGRLFYVTLDNQAVAVDAATGREVWRVKLGDINRGETMTMAPLVVKGKVIVGNAGGEMGVRGWVQALDAGTGRTVWKAYNTGPDPDVLIGPGFRPFYASDRGNNLGVTTWPPDMWKTGGATVWGWVSYDPRLDLIYYGTGNPGPWNPAQRPGDNKWSAGIFARDPDDGQARWFYQWAPHDLFDYDGINENILVDLPIGGRTVQALLRAERNGYVYVMDRGTGQVLSADPYVYITSTKGVDLKSGRLQYASEKEPRIGEVTREICPAAPGAKDWQPAAWSPRTRLLYMPHQNLCMDWESVEANYIAGTPFVGANVRFYGGPGGHRGEFTAWDPVGRRAVWKLRERFPVWSGALATAGDVVFYGTMDRWFKAVDARTGRLLWQFRTGSGIIGQPITFRGPDGKQYVAIFDGVGGWSGAVVSGDLSPQDPTAGGGFVGAMQDLPQYTSKGGTLYVFSLP